MSAVVKIPGVLWQRWHIQLTPLRNVSKYNITRPRPPHFERAVVETVCVPYFHEKPKKKITHIPNYDDCGKEIKKKNLTPLEEILSKECLNWFQQSKLIVFFHMLIMDNEETYQHKLLLKKIGIRTLSYKNVIVKAGIKGTKYEAIEPLLRSYTLFGVSPESDFSKLLQNLKKLPKLVLMAAIVENRLLSVTELNYYGKIKSLDEARMNLLATIGLGSQSLVLNLNQHQNHLVQILNQIQDVKKS